MFQRNLKAEVENMKLFQVGLSKCNQSCNYAPRHLNHQDNMKTLVILLASIFSISSYAGDLNLVCEAEQNDQFYTAGIALGEQAEVQFQGTDVFGSKKNFKVTATLARNNEIRTVVNYEIVSEYLENRYNYRPTMLKISSDNISEPIMVTSTIYCLIRD